MDSQGKKRILTATRFHVLSQGRRLWGIFVAVLDFFIFKNSETTMTETNFFLQIEPLSSPYSDPCSQVQSEIAFMRKTV